MNAEKQLRRARRQIAAGEMTIRGVDPNGRPHSRVRTLGRAVFEIPTDLISFRSARRKLTPEQARAAAANLHREAA